MIDASRLFGWIAVTIGMSYRIPQIRHLYQTKSTEGLSIQSHYLQAVSYVFYTLHGISIGDMPILVMGVVSVIQSLIIIGLYHKYIVD